MSCDRVTDVCNEEEDEKISKILSSHDNSSITKIVSPAEGEKLIGSKTLLIELSDKLITLVRS